MIDMVDPVNTLKRGFSLTRLSSGEVLSDVNQVKKTAVIETEFFIGISKCSVTDIQK